MTLHKIIIDKKLKPVQTTFEPIQSNETVENSWRYFALNNFFDEDRYGFNDTTSMYTIFNGCYTNPSSNAILDMFL
ncbi:unnamed protein product [Adineta ricciae]|uniref:Uncharacterized protein n=1 Tax=Adineta ricciae TaxID=249248 RepID=A0A815R7G4_ADIRI|nr:unnamed protein product [Adineta ricciae]